MSALVLQVLNYSCASKECEMKQYKIGGIEYYCK